MQTPIHIYSSHSLEDIIGNQNWNLTPLDFVDENGPGYSVNIQPFMKMPVIPIERPIQRSPNDQFPTNLYSSQEYLLCLATLVFTAIHVAGWNFDFPSNAEGILWRVSSLLVFEITVAFWVLETIASWTRLGQWKTVYLYVFNHAELGHHRRRMPQRQQIMIKRTMTELSLLWEFVAITPLAIVFGVAKSRGYV